MRRLASWLAGLLAAGLVLMTLVHIPAVQRLMGWSRDGAAACPFGYGTPASPHVARGPFDPAARGRPALDWKLVASTRADVLRWARDHRIVCAERARGFTLECASVPEGVVVLAGVSVSSIWFDFDDGGVVHAVRTIRRTPDVQLASASFTVLRATLAERLGTPSKEQGSALAQDLAAGALRQASCEFVEPDYVATVRVTNLGNHFAITESYAARPRPTKA
jgi:hypothetical protein